MSGECEICGEHCLECKCDENHKIDGEIKLNKCLSKNQKEILSQKAV